MGKNFSVTNLPEINTAYGVQNGIERWQPAIESMTVYPGLEGGVLLIIQRHGEVDQHWRMDARAANHFIAKLQEACGARLDGVTA